MVCYAGDLFSKAAKRFRYPAPIQFRASILGDVFTLKRELATKGNGTPTKRSVLPAVLSEVVV